MLTWCTLRNYLIFPYLRKKKQLFPLHRQKHSNDQGMSTEQPPQKCLPNSLLRKSCLQGVARSVDIKWNGLLKWIWQCKYALFFFTYSFFSYFTLFFQTKWHFIIFPIHFFLQLKQVYVYKWKCEHQMIIFFSCGHVVENLSVFAF